MDKIFHRFLLGLMVCVYIAILGMITTFFVLFIQALIAHPTVGWWVLGIVAGIVLIYAIGWVVDRGSEDAHFESNM